MKKSFVFFGIVFLSMGMIFAGGSTDSADGKTVIEIAVSGSAQELAIHQAKFDLYMERNENITIKPIDIGTERVQKTMTLIGGGVAPDILYINEFAHVFADKDVLLPLNDLIERDNFDLSVFYEALLDPLYFEGNLYALPQEISPFVIYYNKDLFEAAGVPLPADDWTIEDFENAARMLTNPAEQVYGYRHPGTWADQITGWFSRAGASYDLSGDTVGGLGTEQGLEVLKFLHNLVAVEKLSPNPAELQAMGKGSDAMFRNQKSAMESAGLWMLPVYKADPLPFAWDIVRMPMDENQDTKAGVLNWSISKDSENIDAAWDLLKFLTGSEVMAMVAESGMALPATTDEVANQIVLDTNFPENVQIFVDSAADVDFNDQKSVFRSEANTKMQQIVDAMLIGESTPEETQEELVQELNKILAQ